jgi:hypothetical protein
MKSIQEYTVLGEYTKYTKGGSCTLQTDTGADVGKYLSGTAIQVTVKSHLLSKATDSFFVTQYANTGNSQVSPYPLQGFLLHCCDFKQLKEVYENTTTTLEMQWSHCVKAEDG